MKAGRVDAVLGAAAGGAVTAAFWFGIGARWAAVPTLVGAILGGTCAVPVGAGRIKRAWAGRIDALLVSGVAVALANVVVILVLASHGR